MYQFLCGTNDLAILNNSSILLQCRLQSRLTCRNAQDRGLIVCIGTRTGAWWIHLLECWWKALRMWGTWHWMVDQGKELLLSIQSGVSRSLASWLNINSYNQTRRIQFAIRHLEDGEAWDLGALCLIHYWENLKSLRLLSLPIHNGKFLVEIGKQCKYLEKLEFCDLGPRSACCYIRELSLMLTHCKNLKDFSINADNIGRVSIVFASLSKNPQLQRVRLKSSGKLNDTRNLVSSVEELLRLCSKLTTFVCIIDGISQACSVQLMAVLRRYAMLRWDKIHHFLHSFRLEIKICNNMRNRYIHLIFFLQIKRRIKSHKFTISSSSERFFKGLIKRWYYQRRFCISVLSLHLGRI